MKKLLLCTFTLFFLFWGTNALAYSFNFEDIPSTDDTIDIANNFKVDVTKNEDGTASLTFTNTGLEDSFIAGIYLDFTDLTDFLPEDVSFKTEGTDTDLVNFSDDKVKNLAQSNEVDFTADYSAIADKPGSGKQGIDLGESATFLIDADFDTVLAAINSGDLRIGIHVQGIGEDGEDSDSYIAKVPESATMLLLGAGLIGIAGLGRKKLFKKK